MRHLKGITALLAFAWILFAAHVSFASETVHVSVEPTPAELSEAGMVEMNFSVSNYSEYELHSLTIAAFGGGGGIYDIGNDDLTIPPNGSVTGIMIRIQISDSQIGIPISFQVTWTQGGELMGQVVTTTVQRSADPTIQMTRTLSREYAREGEPVDIEYVLTNPTRFDMSNVVLMDDEISQTPLLQNTTLQAGSSVSIRHAFIMPASDVTSHPAVTYTALGKNKTFSAVQPVQILCARTEVVLEPRASDPLAGEVAFTIDVRNTGNQTLQSIVLKDEQGNTVNQMPFSLAAGDSETISYRVMQATNGALRNVSFSLSGVDPYGTVYSMETGIVAVIPPYIDPAQIIAEVRSETLLPWDRASGKIGIRLVIQNASSIELSNVQVYESNAGLVKTVERLAAGENRLDFDMYVSSPRNLYFSVRANDKNGTIRDIGTVSLDVAYSDTKTTPAPTDDSETDRTSGLIALFGNALNRTLAVVGIIIVSAVIILVILNSSEKRRIRDIDRGREERDQLEAMLDQKEGIRAQREVNVASFNSDHRQSKRMGRKENGIIRNTGAGISAGKSIAGDPDRAELVMDKPYPGREAEQGRNKKLIEAGNPGDPIIEKRCGTVAGRSTLIRERGGFPSDAIAGHTDDGYDRSVLSKTRAKEQSSAAEGKEPAGHPRTIAKPRPAIRPLQKRNEIRRIEGKKR